MKIKFKIPLLLITFLIIVLSLIICISIQAQALINEFMASNTTTIQDEDGDYPDWIEIYNPTDSPIDLTGYGLSDRPDNPFRWILPTYILNPDQHLLVFASGKDRKIYPTHWETVITKGDEWRYLDFENMGEVQEDWRLTEYDDSEWKSGPSGIGSRNEDTTIIPQTRTLCIRKMFTVENVANITHCFLHIDYQDGFAAFINGHEIARANYGEEGVTALGILASSFREMQMYVGGEPIAFEIDNIQSILLQGENILAIQIHNRMRSDSDISVIPFLTFGMIVPPLNPKSVPDILKSLILPFQRSLQFLYTLGRQFL